MNILFIAPRFPCPPFKGDQLRVFQQLQMLSRRHTIVLLAFLEKKQDLAFTGSLEEYCQDVYYVKLNRVKSIFNIILNVFFSPLPFQVLYYKSRSFDKILKKILAEKTFDAVHVFLLRMAEYAKDLSGLKVLDCIDSYSLNIGRRINYEKGLKHLILEKELKRVKQYEQSIGKYFSRVLVCSGIDKAYLDNAKRVDVVPNPVQLNAYKDNRERRRNKQIIFSGIMNYFPNIHAVTWFVKECLPLILQNVPEAVFVIAGANPTKQIKKLQVPGKIIVTGFVPSIRDYLNRSAVAVAPMQSGSGMQTKILEAMACGLPVVATGIGCGSIKAKHGEEILIANSAGEFARCVCDIMNDRALASKIGGNAYSFVAKEHSFTGIADMLNGIYDGIAS
jgi:sugar transferase (PEP-CTERM/EpsH1 system associated)